VVYHTGYDSFGNNISTTGTGGDRFGFTGREHDAALNLYYNRARFYDPATGRFLSKDPIGFSAGDMNLYRYVNNSPTNGTDPSGLDWLDSASNFFAGMGDALTGGATDLIRDVIGINNGIDHGSIEYVGGVLAGTGLGVAIAITLPAAPVTSPGMGSVPRSPISVLERIGEACRIDPQHAFPDIVDNFVGDASWFSIPTRGPGGILIEPSDLYQLEGSLNGKAGIFEWIVDRGKVTHRRFISTGIISGLPNQNPKLIGAK